MTKIKICGLMRQEDILAVNAARPDYVGFVFAKGRRRMILHDTAAMLRSRLDDGIKAVGVFLNNEIKEIEKICRDGIIDIVQLHGDEDEAYIRNLKERTDCPLIRAVSVRCREDILRAAELPVDFLLLDTYKQGQSGGTGETFDWQMIPPLPLPYFLAGGINEDNIRTAMQYGAYALDVSSGAETEGKKDPVKIMNLVRKVRGE